MVNILILSSNRAQTNQLKGSLIRLAPELRVSIAQTLAEAEHLCVETRFRLAFVDKSLIRGQRVFTAERLRQPLINRFMPIVLMESSGILSEVNCLPNEQVLDSLSNSARPDPVDPFFNVEPIVDGGIFEPSKAALGMLYLTLPFEGVHLKQILDYVFVEWRARDHRHGARIFIDQTGAARWISEDDIVYVEYASRRVVIHLRKEKIEYKYMPLQKFATQLSSQFIQVHQSYVVNFPAVKSYNRQQAVLKMSGSPLLVPVGRSYQKRVTELIRGIED